MKINVKKTNKNAIIPTRGSNQAAGYDLYACTSTTTIIAPHQTVKIDTGIAVEIPDGYFGAIAARSGLATKNGLAPSNKLGIIDSDYRGSLIVALHNHSDIPQTINAMERIAQLIVIPYLPVEFEEVDELGSTERGDGGFGSTGRQ